MKKFRLLLFFVINFVYMDGFFVFSMTRQQIKNSSKMFKKSCMPKTNVTEDQISNIDKGVFIEERNVMCYVACVYSMGQAIKNNRFLHDALIKQVDVMFPTEMKAPAKSAIENCRGVAKDYTDICEIAFWTAKCLYNTDPDNFLFA